MNLRKLAQLRRELEGLRRARNNLRRSDLVRFANKVGRQPDTKRGKEPTYVSPIPGVRPLSIPSHKRINPYTADSIMDTFEDDLARWEESLEERKMKANNEERKGLS